MKVNLDPLSKVKEAKLKKIENFFANYEIKIKIGEINYSGTDSDIFIKVHNKNDDQTELIRIHKKKSDDFQKKISSSKYFIRDFIKLNNPEIIQKETLVSNKKSFPLNFDRTKQVKISTGQTNETIRLYDNGVPYSLFANDENYLGSGIDIATNFIESFHKNILNNKELIKKFKIIKYSSKNKKYKTNNIIYISNEEFNIAIIKTIKLHLEKGIPLTALAIDGAHWITIVGINIVYTDLDRKDISIDNTTISYIDMTIGSTTESASYHKMRIYGWSKNPIIFFYSSCREGTLISLKDNISLKESEKNILLLQSL